MAISTFAVAAAAAVLSLGATPVAAYADEPTAEPCAKQEQQVAKAEDALARVTAVFDHQKSRVERLQDRLAEASTPEEQAKLEAKLAKAMAQKQHAREVKKAQKRGEWRKCDLMKPDAEEETEEEVVKSDVEGKQATQNERDARHEIYETYIDLHIPEIAAQNAEYVGYGTPNAAAKEFMDEDVLANQGIYPPPDVAAKLQWIQDVGDSLALYDRIWTEFKASIGG